MQLLTLAVFATIFISNINALPLRRRNSNPVLRLHELGARQVTSPSVSVSSPSAASTSVVPVATSTLISTTDPTTTSEIPATATDGSPTNPTQSAPAPSSSASSSGDASSQKYVVAHHIVGNTSPYTINDWADDIALASTAGIDGFALNVGNEPFEVQQVANAYEEFTYQL